MGKRERGRRERDRKGDNAKILQERPEVGRGKGGREG